MALLCVCMLAAGCSESKQDDGKFDASRLPRVSGARVTFANADVANYTSPTTVGQTADDLEKILTSAGWQRFVAPNTAYVNDPAMRTMYLKKGPHALTVFIGAAPAQNNATNVQYSALPLKTDLPFIKDASSIEYSPDRAILSLLTAEPLDKTLDFYRKELGALGWAMWSEKTNAKQAPDGPSGVVHERGAYAHYITDNDPSLALVLTLQKADGGKSRLELKALPVSVLASLHQSYLNSDNAHTPMVDVRLLPRLAGAQEQAERSAHDKLSYSVRGTLADTTGALKTLLAADGWKQYVVPMDEKSSLLAFKKGGQGLSVSFTIEVGKNERTSEVTTVHYSPTRLQYALAIPEDASDVVYDQYRPYLRAIGGGSIEGNRDFFVRQLTASGWQRVTGDNLLKQWPNANIGAGSRGEVIYFNRGSQRPIIMLALDRRDGEKVQAEIRVPPFALPQDLEKGEDIFGLPRPKATRSAGGTGGSSREMHASVPADMGAVLAFYRRELSSRGWKEEAQGAAINADDVTLNFTPADGGTATLKLERKYDMTAVSLVHELPKPVARPSAPAADNSIDSAMKQAQQMMRDAGISPDMLAPRVAPPTAPEAAEALRPLENHAAPVPLPDTAENIEAGSGRLQFSTASSVKAVADFYRSAMRQQGWASQTSVINNANMVVLNFAKGRDTVVFTIMKMGSKTNVSADGSAFREAAAKPAARPAPSTTPANADKPSPPATEDDLIA